MLKYSDLTEKEKKFITNGCGRKGGFIKVPNFIFKASCNHHDFRFWRGYSLKDFDKANREFYIKMKEDIAEVAWYLKPYYHTWAYTYMVMVETFGQGVFEFSDTYKTRADLHLEMQRAEQLKEK